MDAEIHEAIKCSTRISTSHNSSNTYRWLGVAPNGRAERQTSRTLYVCTMRRSVATLEERVLSIDSLWGERNRHYRDIPSTFNSAEEYVECFAPTLVEETCENILSSITSAIATSAVLHVEASTELPATVSGTTFSVQFQQESRSKRVNIVDNAVYMLFDITSAKLDTTYIQKKPTGPFAVGTIIKSNNDATVLKIVDCTSDLLATMRSLSRLDSMTDLPDEKPGSKKNIVFVPGTKLSSLSQELGALYSLNGLDKRILSSLLRPIPSTATSTLLRQHEPRLKSLNLHMSAVNHRFNQDQLEAIEACMCNEICKPPFPFTLIQGPPGTGKTHTIWGLLNILHLMEFEKYYASIVESLNQPTRTCARRPHLLVCAPSNAATNNALKRVVQLGFFQTCGTKYTPAVVRIGASNFAQTDHSDEFCVEAKTKALMSMQHSEWLSWFSRQLHTVRSIEIEMKSQLSKLALLHERHENPDTVTANLLRMYENRDRAIADLSRLEYLRSYFDGSLRNQDELETLKMGLEASFADEAEIVFSTLASSGRSTLNRTKRTFTTVIIDEAAQCTELTTLFPLFTGVEHSVLIGDPKQLPSTVLSPIARQLQYGKSLFQRFVENHITVHSLGVQYRMHPDIRQFPSEFFYGGSLKDAENIKFECARLDFTLLSSHAQRVEFGPYLLFDTIIGVEERNARGSLCNSYEAQTCVTLLELLMASQARDARKLSVAILSPYIHQCELIQNLVDPLEIPGTITLLISTVDAFQGREADIVIFTCVRDASTTIGFLSDARRMNVALTRARSALWLLCNTQNAVKSELWRSLITDARERGLVIPAATLQHLV